MHPLRTHGLSVLAMLLLLAGTAAPALVRMTCVMGDHSVVNLGQAADCCPTDHRHASTTVSATCCEVLQAQPQRTDFVPAAAVAMPVLLAALLPAVVVPAEGLLPMAHRDAWSSRPPPLPRSQRLAAFGTFLI